MSKWRPTNSSAIYVIGDIHGKYKQLKLILNRILPLRKINDIQDKLIFLGDYVDRFVDTHRVLDELIACKKQNGDQVVFLYGNHEKMMLRGIEPILNSKYYRFWMENGGDATLIGYLERAGLPNDNPYVFPRNRIKDIIPKEHIDFLKNSLINTYELYNYIFAHAGYDPVLEPSGQTEFDLLWSLDLFDAVKRYKNENKPLPWEKTIVVGHHWDGPFIMDKFMMIDCTGSNQLMVLELNSMEAFIAKVGKAKLVKLFLSDAAI